MLFGTQSVWQQAH